MTDADDPSAGLSNKSAAIAICLALAIGTLLLYLPVGGFDFVNYDDPGYVTANELVQKGLTWEGIKWAFAGSHLSNWHPLTTLSHLAMCELFDLDAGKHHLANVIVHAGNAVLLFLVLFRLTRSRWPSAMVAALLAAHPLHVESVAWISERKDGLCLMAWLLTILAYARHVERPGKGRYAALIAMFAVGILTKPMIITLPCVLLLLDVWPLRRAPVGNLRDFLKGMKPLVIEKLPLFGLSIFLGVMTIVAQRDGMIVEMERLPMGFRLGNAAVAYVLYLGKMIWPTDLAVFYPHPGQWPFWAITASVILIVGLSAWAIRLLRRQPWIAVGWFWYLGSLVPVIGLVQVGEQAIADRYAYIPLLGIYAAICFGAAECLRQRERARVMASTGAAAIVIACAWVSSLQLQYWRNSETLFRRALAVTRGNDVAHANLGAFLGNNGKMVEAREHFLEAYKINPHGPRTLENLAILADFAGDAAAAARYRSELIAEVGGSPEDYLAVARSFGKSGDATKALEHFTEALRLDPNLDAARVELGLIYARLGRFEEAEAAFSSVVARKPNDAQARYYLALAQGSLTRMAAAIESLNVALKLRPDWPAALNTLAGIRASHLDAQWRDGAAAVALAKRAVDLSGGTNALYLDTLAMAYAETGEFEQAVKTETAALQAASAAGQGGLSGALEERRELFRKGLPYRRTR